MMLGEIRAHRPEGAPEGVRLVELADRSLRAIRIPRADLAASGDLPDLAGAGVFFLVGPAPAAGDRPRAFLGGTQDLAGQLTHHGRAAPFPWEAAVAVPLRPPKIPRFHKELIKLVQFHCHRRAVEVRSHEVISPEPTAPSLVPAFVERDLAASRTAIETLLFALGHPLLGVQLRVVK
mgnify:CR=1 FL=1